MNEPEGKTASCLAITEKRAHRPGGCVGIFFQLFDWNRRFAKKKLFSRKLLPPALAKQSSKKFSGDEKMPKTKIHLIADENNGGFPNVKGKGNHSVDSNTEQKHEMQTPGLVARLMGLESLPTVQRDKHKKDSNSGSCFTREEKFVNGHGGSDREDVNLERANTKVDSRPQKLQKTGQFERRAVTRFGAEALQIRSVLSRTKKHHHPKLTSPVKSPRISSSRNVSRASRLIDAATRILEPGLQANNRNKCALTYSSLGSYAPKEGLTEEIVVMSPNIPKHQNNVMSYDVSVGKALMGHTSCRNCGNLLDVVDYRPNVEDQLLTCPSSASNFVNASSMASERMRPGQPVFFPEQEMEVDYQKNCDQPSIFADKQNPEQSSSPEGQTKCQYRSQHLRAQEEEPPLVAFKQKAPIQDGIPVGKDRVSPKPKLSNLQSRRASSAASSTSGTKDFVALNRSLSSRTRPRVPTKLDNSSSDTERKLCSRRDDSMPYLRSPVRKRRTGSVNQQIEDNGSVHPMSMRQRNIKCDIASDKELGFNARTTPAHAKNRSVSEGDRNGVDGSKANDAISFTFSSPLRHKTFISTGLKERRDQIDGCSLHQRRPAHDKDEEKTSLQKQLPLRGDALGALLEQKLKELTCEELDELTAGASLPKRSTAMILQELIAALTAEQPISPGDHIFSAHTPLQSERKMGGIPVRFSHDGDHLSPGSVLDASFSNDSCLSSSLEDISGCRFLVDSIDYPYDEPQPTETDADLLDSVTCTNEKMGRKMAMDLLDHVSRILQSINLAGGRLTGTKLVYAKDVIINAELLFANTTPRTSGMKSFLIGHFILDELETLASAMWMNLNSLLGFEHSKAANQLGGFVLDCVLECLDSKYSRYCNSGFNAWRRAKLCMNADKLIREVAEEVRRWTSLTGMIPDEIIEWEMSHSLGKWTDFEIEAFETGVDIDWDILQILVEEVVMDLWELKLASLRVAYRTSDL